jgi:hypothetical protein
MPYMQTERRRRRGDTLEDALNFQLAACVEDEGLAAMVLADSNGLPLAAWGHSETCEEAAALAPFEQGAEGRRRVRFGGHELYLCAVGGNEIGRRRSLDRSATGVSRILGRWIVP